MDIDISRVEGRSSKTDFYITVGEPMTTAITISDLDDNPIDLTNCTFKARIQFAASLDLSTADGDFTVSDPTTGIVQLNIPDTTSDTFIIGSYDYDLWIFDSGGVPFLLLSGLFIVEPAITPIP